MCVWNQLGQQFNEPPGAGAPKLRVIALQHAADDDDDHSATLTSARLSGVRPGPPVLVAGAQAVQGPLSSAPPVVASSSWAHELERASKPTVAANRTTSKRTAIELRPGASDETRSEESQRCRAASPVKTRSVTQGPPASSANNYLSLSGLVGPGLRGERMKPNDIIN